MIYLAARWAVCLLVILQVVIWYMLDWRASQGACVVLTGLSALVTEYYVRKCKAAAAEHDAWMRDIEATTASNRAEAQKLRDQLLTNTTQDIWDDEAKRKACDRQD